MSCAVLPLHAGCVTCSVLQNALAYSDTVVSYAHKMFMK